MRALPRATQHSSSSLRPSRWCASLPRRCASCCVGFCSSALKLNRARMMASNSLHVGSSRMVRLSWQGQ